MNSRSVWNELNKNSKRQLQRNQKYWDVREREKLWHDKLLKESNSYDIHVQRLYRDTIRAVEDEINSFFTRFSGKEGISITEAKKRVSQLDIEAYARKAEKYVPAKDLSKRANDEMRIYNLTMKVNRLEMLKAEIGMHLVDCFDELESFMGEKLSAQVKSEFERQAGILGHTVTNPSKLAQSIVNASFHNATFSERIWSHHDQLRFEIAKQLTSGLVTGKHPRELSRNIRKAFGVSAYNAMRLMRTELARVQTDAQIRCYEQGGYEMFEFITVGIKACPICQALDGELFKIADMRVGTNAPPMHPNCRCSTSAATVDENDEEFDNTDPLDFIDMLKAAKESQPKDKRWRVDVHNLEDYKNDKLHTTFGGSCIAITPENDIISVCKKKGDFERGQDLIRKAVENGGDRLDSYDGNHGFYTKQGFEPVSWCKFDEEYAPEGWAEDWGAEEDIIFYRYTGQKNQLSLDEFKASVPPAESYDEAMNIRDKVIREDNR